MEGVRKDKESDGEIKTSREGNREPKSGTEARKYSEKRYKEGIREVLARLRKL